MKFLVDAQLPYRLKDWLLAKGFDAIHTVDLPAQNLSSDMEIVQVEINNSFVIGHRFE